MVPIYFTGLSGFKKKRYKTLTRHFAASYLNAQQALRNQASKHLHKSRTLQAGKLASTVMSYVKITQGHSPDSRGDHIISHHNIL